MLRTRFSGLLLVGGLALSATAFAQEAYTTRQLNVRAGPDTSYPVVAVLGAGTPVDVAGCLSDYLWCDVVFGDNRGWVNARSLQYTYQSRQVPLYDYGAAIGLPIVTFSLLNYWDDHYRQRSWYRDRPRWHNAPRSNWSGYDRTPRDNWRDRQAQPQYRQPRQIEPQYRQPRQAQPQYSQPRQTEPQYRQPRQNEPQSRQPRQTEPQSRPPRQTEPQSRQPGRPDGNQPTPSREPTPGGN